METIIAVILIVLIIVLAVIKIVKEKHKGAKCIGCPHYDKGNCSKK